MVFSSLEFLFMFFAVSMLAYFITPLKWRNIVLFIVSMIFYGWGEPIYVVIMIVSIIIDYTCGYYAGKYRETDKKKARLALIMSAVLNLSILCFFKYYDFIVTNLNYLPIFGNIPTLGLSLPIGISFYTFQTMSYTLDIYMGNAKVQKNPITFGTYVVLFPQLIAGPIVRYQDVDDQLRHRTHSMPLFASGVRTFMCGAAKKLILANGAGALWDSLRDANAADPTVLGAWLGIIFYSFQIYFDFSGYSDMAIGMGKMLGMRFLENFNYPYISKSITEFWRRWHISLGTWFREYVYIPLGGNRCSKLKSYRNILIVWFLTGLWHGASWNFVLWGLYYCALLIIEKAFLGKILAKLPSAVSHLYSLFFIVLGWWLFFFEDLSFGVGYLGTMFGAGSFTNSAVTFDLVRSLVFLLILGVASTPLPRKLYYKYYEKSGVFRIIASVGCVLLFGLLIGYLVDSTYNPFLYFRF